VILRRFFMQDSAECTHGNAGSEEGMTSLSHSNSTILVLQIGPETYKINYDH
jgi:hypothetical protein